MINRPILSRITIFPVKSLDGLVLQKAQIGKGGCLRHDREYAILNEDLEFVNGKSNPAVHNLRSRVAVEDDIISFRKENETEWLNFHLNNERADINTYLSSFFGFPVQLYQNSEGRFLDIPDLSGITILSEASLGTVSHWFGDLPMEETKNRFRATVELSGVSAFWEDHLFAEPGSAIVFKLGEVELWGVSPRARCVVPSRHPQTGEVTRGFQKTFAKKRAENLPEWSLLEDYGHYYHLSVDCHIPATEEGKWLQLGDELTVIGKKTWPIEK